MFNIELIIFENMKIFYKLVTKTLLYNFILILYIMFYITLLIILLFVLFDIIKKIN